MKTKKIIRKLRREAEFWRQGFKADKAEILQAAANRLEMLSVELKHLNAKMQRITEERDAATAEIQRCCETCALCSRNNGTGQLCPWLDDCNQRDGDHWEWRGVNYPKYLSTLQQISPDEKHVLLSGEWGAAKTEE